MLVYYFVPFIVSNRYLLFWVSNGYNSVTVQNRTHVYMNFFHHKDLGNHLLQLYPKIVKHPVYVEYTNKFLCVLYWRLQCTQESSSHSYHEPNINNPNFPSYFFQTLTLTLPSHLPSGSSCSVFVSKNSSLPHACYMTRMYFLPSINICWRVTVMKLTTQSSTSLCSYLPLTSNIPLIIPLTLTLNPIPSLDTGDQISHPHKINRTMSDL